MRPFDDAQTIDKRVSSTDPANDTSVYDPYRQGVELTLPKHYAAGMVKIHCGFRGESGNHKFPDSVLGQLQTFRSSRRFSDYVTIDPIEVVTKERSKDVDFVSDPDINENNFDGVLEPLGIRRNRNEHKIWAYIDEGNLECSDSSNGYVTVAKPADEVGYRLPVLDVGDQKGNVPTFVEPECNSGYQRTPFREHFITPGARLSFTMSGDLVAALLALKPSTDEYIPEGYEIFGSTGFDY